MYQVKTLEECEEARNIVPVIKDPEMLELVRGKETISQVILLCQTLLNPRMEVQSEVGESGHEKQSPW